MYSASEYCYDDIVQSEKRVSIPATDLTPLTSYTAVANTPIARILFLWYDKHMKSPARFFTSDNDINFIDWLNKHYLLITCMQCISCLMLCYCGPSWQQRFTKYSHTESSIFRTNFCYKASTTFEIVKVHARLVLIFYAASAMHRVARSLKRERENSFIRQPWNIV